MGNLKSKEEMIKYMKDSDMSIDDFSLGECEFGWTCKYGAYENFLEAKHISGFIESSIYGGDLA